MTPEQVHRRLVTLADELGEQHLVLSEDFPKDAEGFPVLDNSDLADALRSIAYAETILTRLAHKLARKGTGSAVRLLQPAGGSDQLFSRPPIRP